MSEDEEVAQIEVIVDALNSLDENERDRVMNYLNRRYSPGLRIPVPEKMLRSDPH